MRPFDLTDRSLSHPEKQYTVTSSLNISICAFVVTIVTITWFAVEGRLHKSVVRRNVVGVIFTVYFMILGACLMTLLVYSIKCLAGHLRPYFLAACRPSQTMVQQLMSQNSTWVDEKMTETICTNPGILRYRWSFPSGHSAEAWYAMTMSILIIQNFTVKYNNNNYVLLLPFKALFQFVMFAFASWVSMSRTLDYHLFWYDAAVGSVMGWLIAVIMFYWFVKPLMERTEKRTPQVKEGGRSDKVEMQDIGEIEEIS